VRAHELWLCSQPGQMKYSPLDVEFQGPSSLRPVGTFELGFLVNVSHRLALWLHVLFDEPQATMTDMNAKLAEIEQAQADLLAAVKRHEVDRGLMTKLRKLEGPRRTYIRVLLADVRFFVPLVCLWLYATASLVGLRPALGLLGFLVLVCGVWL
jgi:capsule polysaccharide modification protein KpsS